MLIQFSVENYRSILNRQTFSMAASSYFKELEALNTFDTGIDKVPNLVRSSVVYGPNASGKTSIIHALYFMRDCVINSAKGNQANDEIEVEPFRLTKNGREGDSEFEIIFIEESIRYQYGFRCNKERVTEEWLFAYPEGSPQKWFQRVYSVSNNQEEYRFSSKFFGGRKRQDWKEQTRPNALFLSTALQLNNEQLKPVLNWFQKRLRVIRAHQFSSSTRYSATQCRDEGKKEKILEFLNSADLSISGIQIEARPFNPEFLDKDLPAVIREEFSKKMAGHEILETAFFHQDAETQESIKFSLDEESDGTQALFSFAGPWLDVIENERVLIVDELDTSLHPLIVHQLIKLLNHENCKAQIVFTTHDTTILSQKLLRRDQIWFTEKDKNNSTQLYPLSDFSPRDNEAIERGYLNGRYGGIPFLKDLDFYG